MLDIRVSTIIPDHQFILGVFGSFATTYNHEYISFMDHFNNADSSPQLSTHLLSDLCTQFEYFEALLGSDGEIWLILIEAYVKYLLFFTFHLYISLPCIVI